MCGAIMMLDMMMAIMVAGYVHIVNNGLVESMYKDPRRKGEYAMGSASIEHTVMAGSDVHAR